jgi:hypothetical protein
VLLPHDPVTVGGLNDLLHPVDVVTCQWAANHEAAGGLRSNARVDRSHARRYGDLGRGGEVGWGRRAAQRARRVECRLVFRGAEGLEERFRGADDALDIFCECGLDECFVKVTVPLTSRSSGLAQWCSARSAHGPERGLLPGPAGRGVRAASVIDGC